MATDGLAQANESSTLKRKATNNLASGMPVRSRPRLVTTPIDIDPEGDLIMDLHEGALKVSRKVLSLSSPVFLAMLGNHSRFKEANQTVGPNEIQTILFEDDNFEIMTIIAKIMHLQNGGIPKKMTFFQLYQVAVLCDKYDLRRCLGIWIDLWAKPHFESSPKDGYEGLLFMSIVFEHRILFKRITRHLILNTRISTSGLITEDGFPINERISPKVLGK